jgi:BirA family transcriptional regulator, biotin operon repressor / biotin---[acetyl-CoA-carboxylase] ligase
MGRAIVRLAEVGSTNRWAAERFDDLDDGTVVVADRQTQGQGRLGRAWQSAVAGNLYATLVLKVAPGAPGAAAGALPRGFPNLTQYMAVVLARVVESAGARPAIKWPNDLLCGGRKLAGILAETVSRDGRVVGAALGAGVNLAMGPRDLQGIDQPATSLNVEIGRAVDRDAFLESLLEEFDAGYRSFLREGFPALRAEFLSRTPFLGRTISVHSADSRITGTACDITEQGVLVVQTEQGRLELNAGDVQ